MSRKRRKKAGEFDSLVAHHIPSSKPKTLEEMFAIQSRIMRICVLNENKEVVALTDGEWFRWMLEHGDPKQRVAESVVGSVRVSTMFLGAEVSSLRFFD